MDKKRNSFNIQEKSKRPRILPRDFYKDKLQRYEKELNAAHNKMVHRQLLLVILGVLGIPVLIFGGTLVFEKIVGEGAGILLDTEAPFLPILAIGIFFGSFLYFKFFRKMVAGLIRTATATVIFITVAPFGFSILNSLFDFRESTSYQCKVKDKRMQARSSYRGRRTNSFYMSLDCGEKQSFEGIEVSQKCFDKAAIDEEMQMEIGEGFFLARYLKSCKKVQDFKRY